MTTFADNTILSALDTCDMKAGLRYVLGLTTGEERLELDAGSAVHEALAEWHKGHGIPAAMSAFDKLYLKHGIKVSVEERLSYANVKRVLTRFFAYYKDNALPYTPQKDLVEVVFEAPLDEHGDFRIIGRIDQVISYQGRLVIGENKTTGSLSGFWKDKWPMSSQLTTYVYGGQHGVVDGKPLGLPVEEALVLGIELRKVPNSETKCRDHKLPYRECGDLHVKWEFSGPHPRPDGFIQRWRRDALKAAKRYAWMQANVTTIREAVDQLEQQGQFSQACMFCEFKDYCRQGLPVELMEANLQVNRWDPRDLNHTGLVQIQPTTPALSPSHPTRPETTPREGVLVGSAPTPSNARRTP